MELHDVFYGIEYVARPLLLFFSSENKLLWFRYREYDLSPLILVFEFSIYKVWKSVGYGVSKCWIRLIKDFLEYGYAISSLMDISYWCLTCLKVKAEHQMPFGLLQQPEIPEWKWERITVDFVTKLPRTSSGHGTIWILAVNARGIRNPFRHEYGLPLSDRRSEIMAAQDRQKSFVDKRRKPLEFKEGEYVMLKVSPWKGVVRFGKKGKLAPRFVGPFKITERVGPVSYRLRLPEELNGGHDTFHVSNLKKCLADPTLQVPLDEIQIDAKLNFMEEPVEVRWNLKRGPEFTWEREDQIKLKYPHLFNSSSS
ncbi:hypothetical protein Tco_0694227 [Tanacetum coccineum]